MQVSKDHDITELWMLVGNPRIPLTLKDFENLQ